MKTLLFFIQYKNANFLCVFQLETIMYAGKSLIVHIKVIFIWKIYFLEVLYVKVLKNHNCFTLQSTIKDKYLYFYINYEDQE
jgi:hypothetical protein